MDFYGTDYSAVYINNNGNLTFNGPLATYTPFDLATNNIPMIAPFFADVDTRAGATAAFGTGTVDGHSAWGVTWPKVGCYETTTSVTDDFQVLLIDRSDIDPGDFDIEFNYNQMQWDAGQASGGNANCQGGTPGRVGYTNGVQADSFELPGSATTALLDNAPQSLTGHDLNSTVLGRYDFAVRNGAPAAVTTTTGALSDGTTTAATLTESPNTPVTDGGTLSGETATAGGTATYSVYSDDNCASLVGTPQTVTVTNGVIPTSSPVSLPTGTYYFQTVYSGDSHNNGSNTTCGANVLTVAQTPVTITADNQSKVYGAADPAFTSATTGLAPGDSLATRPTCGVAVPHTDVGTYPITCSGATAGSQYSISYVAGTLTVTPATATVTANNQTKIYGAADPAFTYTVSGLVTGDSLSATPTCGVTGAHTDVGTYPIACSGADAGSNYRVSYVAGTLSVGKATVTIAADNLAKTYGTTDPTFTFRTSGLVPGDSLTAQPTCRVTGSHAAVGTYPVSCSGADAGSNYTVSYVAGTLTVNKAAVTITANNRTKVYGTADPAFTYNVSGVVAGDSLVTQPVCGVAGPHANVGTYSITCTGADAGSNYTVSYVAGTLTVNKAAVTITADNQTTVYGAADPTFTYQSSGLVNGDSLTAHPTCGVSGQHSNVGTYSITCAGADAGSNYTVSYVAGTLTITKATVTITPNNETKTFGAADPAFTFQTMGLLGGDTLTTQPTCGVAGAHVDVGTYPITCTGADAGPNYTVAYSSAATLTVTKATPAVTTTPSGSVAAGGRVSDTAQVTGPGVITGTVRFTLYGPGDSNCASPLAASSQALDGGRASSGTIQVGAAGVYQWVATYTGDANNNSALSGCGSEFVTVTPQVLTGDAYGVAGGVGLLGGPLQNIRPVGDTGAISTTASTSTSPCVATLPGLIAAKTICDSVTTVGGYPASSTAQASIASAAVGIPSIPAISIQTIQTTSTTSCAGSSGSVTIAYLSVGGVVVISKPTAIAPNTTVNVGVVKLVLNEQLRFSTPDKGLTVNAVHIIVGAVGVATVNAVIASAESDIDNCP